MTRLIKKYLWCTKMRKHEIWYSHQRLSLSMKWKAESVTCSCKTKLQLQVISLHALAICMTACQFKVKKKRYIIVRNFMRHSKSLACITVDIIDYVNHLRSLYDLWYYCIPLIMMINNQVISSY